MKGTKIETRPQKKARIEIIPLIDVIFFLLATFVLFTLSLNRIQSVPIDLPVPSLTTTPPDKDDMVVLQVSAEDSLFWNREPIEFAELKGRLAVYQSQTDTPKIMISNDEKARFGAAVRVLDEIRNAGIDRFSVETTNTRQTGR
jgi:biopolymer transport protein ExbD